MRTTLGLLLLVAVTVHGYSGGAPPEVCDDMVPKHPVPPQRSPLPYSVKVDKDQIQAGQSVKITISGRDGYKGMLVQVRQSKKGSAIGQFAIADKDKYFKSISCGQGSQVRMLDALLGHAEHFISFFMLQNAATHKNSEDKNNHSLEWKATGDVKGTVTVFVTVARDGGTFWTAKPTATIKIN